MNRTKKILMLIVSLIMLASALALSASAASAPAAPKSVTAKQTTSSITLSWPKISGATGYRIYYKLPADLSWRTAVSFVTSTSKTFKNLPEGQHYTFAIRSYFKSGNNIIWGDYRQITTATQTAAPSKITAEQSINAIKLTWSKVNSATGYRIYYKTSASENWKTAVSDTKNTTHTFKNLPAGKKYIFAIRSYSKSTLGTFFGKHSTIETATKPETPTIKAIKNGASLLFHGIM